MEVDFDKQIDTILRDLVKGNTLAESPPVSHLDADELSAFAENVLPPKARLRAMEHLADCSSCRKTLTFFADLNTEAQSETIHEEVKTIAVIPAIPWYSKLFAFPNLSYAMGALALLLTGTIGVLLWQNTQDSGSAISKIETNDKVKGPSGASSDGDEPVYQVPATNSANSSSSASNSTRPSTTNSLATPTSPGVGNTTTEGSSEEPNKPLPTPGGARSTDTTTLYPENEREVPLDDKSEGDREKEGLASKKAPANSSSTIVPSTGGETAPSSSGRSDDNVTRQQVQEPAQNRAQNNVMSPDGGENKRSVPAPPAMKKSAPRDERKDVSEEATEKAEKNKIPEPSPTKSLGGKTFRSVGGVWTDLAYKGGPTTNIKRETKEYKKLDSVLRSTADNLGGTVIIVWKSKNYKIQ